jgi:hypothetical protein
MNAMGWGGRYFRVISREFRLFLIPIRSAITTDNYLKILILLTITGLILRLYHLGTSRTLSMKQIRITMSASRS